MTGDLYLVSMPLDVGALLRNANDRASVDRGALDLGYHVHGWLSRCLGKDAIRPFALQERRLLGYSSMDADALRAQIDTFADPSEHQVLSGPVQTKAMPALEPGRRVDFEVRVAPTVRLASALGDIPKGGELDAFLAHRERVPDDLRSREEVYREWLIQRMTRDEAAVVHRVEVVQWKRTRVLRRTQGERRQAVTFELPEVSVQGTLTTGPGFHALLRQGVGRHKAFGFGMVLLRPPTC